MRSEVWGERGLSAAGRHLRSRKGAGSFGWNEAGYELQYRQYGLGWKQRFLAKKWILRRIVGEIWGFFWGTVVFGLKTRILGCDWTPGK